MKTEQSIPWWRGFRTLLTVLVVLGLLLQSTPPSVVTAISASISNTQSTLPEYIDPDFGWSIRYPEDWIAEVAFENLTAQAENVIRRRLALYGPDQATIWIDVSENLSCHTAESWFHTYKQPLLSSSITETVLLPATLDGHSAVLAVDNNDKTVLPQAVVVGATETVAIEITYVAADGGAARQLFDNIVHSFVWRQERNTQYGRDLLTDLPVLNEVLFPSRLLATNCCGIDSPGNICVCCTNDSGAQVGNCVWWACHQRRDVPCAGNANTWATCATRAGKRVDTTPAAGALVTWNSANHIAYVESVNGNQIYISEMNCYASRACGGNTGYNGVTYRWVSTSDKQFIHSDSAPPPPPNRAPNTPTLESPPNDHTAQDGRAPTLCWNNTGDPDGDPVQFYAEVYDSPFTANSGWTSNTCWRPSSLDGRYHTYKWRVRAKDGAGLESDWSSTRQFTIQTPNQSPTIAFNTANGNSANLIESREQNWTFQGTSSDPDGSVNRVELRCSGDNCGSGASQASGTTSWSLARSAMAGRNEMYFRVYDNQGASATSRHLDLRIDLAAPTTGNNLIGTAGSNGWYTSPVEVRLHADDGSTGGARVGVDRVVYRLDGGTWQNRSGSDVSLVINGDGTHIVDYYAVDKVGNTESQKQITFKIDATPPSAPGTATEIHGVLSGQWQKGLDDPSFIWVAATDTASGIWYYRVNWNNTLQVTQGSAYDPPAVRTGSYDLSVQAVDQAGNVGPVGAAFIFRYDGTPPPAPAIQNHDGVASGVWQNSIRTPNFSWLTPTDQGSGVAGYNLYWGSNASGESSTLVTGNTFVSATPICAENEAATYYLRLRTQDGVGWQSEWVGYALAYDGAPPNATLVANYGQPVAHQTSVHLDIAASDQGSGVAQMRLSNSGYNWSAWMPPTSELYWEIPAIGRREHAIYLQLVDGAGNVSDIISDTVYFDVNVPFPKSENFHMWDSLLAAGGGIITSTNLIQRVTVGQPSESVALQSAQYLLNPGFQAGALAAPIQVPTYTTYMQLGSLMASATTSATAITSGHFRLYGSLGQPSDMRTVTSTNFTASLGFWAGAAHDVTPEPPEPPEPLPPPECEFYSLSINNGALFTRSPLVTLNLCGPDPVQMMLSNDGGFSGATWQPYTQTVSWTLTTYGNYVLPRLVYARYRDGSDAIHGNFFDDIIYDPSAPEGAVAFDAATLLPGMKLQAASQPLRVTSTPDTELFLSFADDSSGMAEIQIGLTPDFAEATWQPYAGIVPMTFTEEGVQTVYVRTRDQAGNTSAVVTDTLMVDTIPPLGEIYPLDKVVGSNTLSLTMLLAGWDNISGVSDVRISTVESLENALWQPYAPEATVPISYTGVAQPLIYAQFRDAAGNVSAVYTTTYLVDTTPPVLYVEVAPGDTLTRTLNILVYDELSRIGEMHLSNDPLFLEGVVTLPYTQTVTWAFDARRVVWVQIADSVGNFSEPFPAYAHEGAAIAESKVYLPLVLRQQ